MELDAYLLANPQIKAIVLNYPCNPTGIVLTHEELQQLAAILKKHPAIVIVLDDVYRDLNFGKHETLLNVDPSFKERTIVIHSAAKGLIGAPDIRAGFMGGPARFIKAMTGLQQLAIACTPYLTQYALVIAIEDYLTNTDNVWREDTRQAYQNNVLLAGEIAASSGFTFIEPQGAFYLFVQASHLMNCAIPDSVRTRYQLGMSDIKTDVDLAKYFLIVAGVAIVPGSGFGLDASDGYFRISCAMDTKTLINAMNSLGESARILSNTQAIQASHGAVSFWSTPAKSSADSITDETALRR